MDGALTPDWRRTPAETAADILLEIQAINIRPDEPFTFTSGRLSPVYVDCRKIIAFTNARRRLMDMGKQMLTQLAGAEAFDLVAGGETAGIPFAAWMADQFDLPMAYIRKKPKGFGKNARIEGEVREGARVLLVEDLATDGGSKLSFIDAIRDAGMEVAHCFVVFHYGVFPQSVTSMRDKGVELHGLCTWWDVLAAAPRHGYTDAQLSEVRAFLADPEDWDARHRTETA
jgi:orotate phosphoribosyltransferase